YLSTRTMARSPPFPYTTLFRSYSVSRPFHLSELIRVPIHPNSHQVHPPLHRPTTRSHLPAIDPTSREAMTLNPRRPKTNGSPRKDRKSTRLNSSHVKISYAVFC